MFASLQVLRLRVLLVAGLIAVTSLSISQVASASTAATTPTFSPVAGTYTSAQMVTISDTAPNAIIYYTTNGTMPTTASSVYSAPITISSTETLEAIATIGGCSGCLTSAVVTAGYFITPLAVGGALEWTWMGGSSTMDIRSDRGYGQPGVYGTLGTPAATNIPGGRSYASTWTDSRGNLWLFGGGYDVNGNNGSLNDLWEFYPSTTPATTPGQWAWMGGSSTVGQSGVYGTLGTPAATNIPGGRGGPASWTDSSGRLWLFGGGGSDADGNGGLLNDLWEFN
jgi:hypothetical protein